MIINGYLDSWLVEKRGEERFISLKFEVNEKIILFHQIYMDELLKVLKPFQDKFIEGEYQYTHEVIVEKVLSIEEEIRYKIIYNVIKYKFLV